MNVIIFIVLSIHILKIGAQLLKSDLEVNTTEGTVIGSIADDGDYFAFYGIPYAGPASGSNRFKAPQPPKKYEKLVADRKSIVCVQPIANGSIGIEDCLTLNIFTKYVNSSQPVLIWINGIEYSRIYNPTVFSYKKYMNDLILIEVNYRLSIFGFLCLGVQEAPGNAGLKDLLQALKWINENVASFGGDPDNIILLGHGTGAAMVDILTLTPESSHSLISKVITISGSALSPWAVAYEPVEYAKALAARLGAENKTNEELANFFKTVNKEKLVEEIVQFKFTNQSLLFAPCVENLDLPGSLLTEAPYTILKNEKYDKTISYIAIFVTFEVDVTSFKEEASEWLKHIQNNFTEFLPVFFKFKNQQTHVKVSKSLLNTYFGDKMENMADMEFFEYEGDISVKLAMIESVKERAKSSKAPTRLLVFNCHDSKSDLVPQGPTYGEIIFYIFDKPFSEPQSLANEMITKRMIAFANTGLPDFSNDRVTWLAATENQLYYMNATGHSKREYNEKLSSFENLKTKITWKEDILPYYHIPGPVVPHNDPDSNDSIPMIPTNDTRNPVSVELAIFLGITILLISAGLGFLVHRKLANPKFLQIPKNDF